MRLILAVANLDSTSGSHSGSYGFSIAAIAFIESSKNPHFWAVNDAPGNEDFQV